MTNNASDGGAASPVPHVAEGHLVRMPAQELTGMSLREHYAGLAMQGFCANGHALPTQPMHFKNLAEDAFAMADAMLAERAKRSNGGGA